MQGATVPLRRYAGRVRCDLLGQASPLRGANFRHNHLTPPACMAYVACLCVDKHMDFTAGQSVLKASARHLSIAAGMPGRGKHRAPHIYACFVSSSSTTAVIVRLCATACSQIAAMPHPCLVLPRPCRLFSLVWDYTSFRVHRDFAA